ncbi:hypothetical protein CMK11_10990, partial [Candidatus Poribacteria bacterium]|nr:hypothetical protein [Candidatus Poribacteria bacterium]
MAITYPKLIEDRLAKDSRLRGALDTTRTRFSDWLNTSTRPFFPDYTDHGTDHLESVLHTCVELMTPEAQELFTPADAAILTLAVFLHDSAMHLSKDGLKHLIHGDATSRCVDGFDDKPWDELWDEFLFQARRWDDRQLRDILGETEDERPIAAVRDPFDDYANLTERDYKLLGEFIRQHHPRMAHEFAVFGVPFTGPDSIEVSDEFHEHDRYIAGLVARSHGLPLRDCAQTHRDRFDVPDYRDIHAVYLMVLLRVGDYLQIEASRAPKVAFQYRTFPSPRSRLEHRAHQSVDSVSWAAADPESITVSAGPEDVHVFLQLREWLTDIQAELDASWAVLGETYGRLRAQELDLLGLRIRRVRSSLDDVEGFSNTARPLYVPERLDLGVARPDLLKLLVRPLYGNHPSYGVRELMQNAADAVRERWALAEQYPEIAERLAMEDAAEPEVVIRLEDDRAGDGAAFSIVDRGAGMTLDVIRDYFLTAGASFRQSDAWQSEFGAGDGEPTRVLRSGRFGVGVLAGFLLGDEMTVTTRHVRANEGYQFSVALGSAAPIQVLREPTLPFGTRIHVRVSWDIAARFRSANARVAVPPRADWYLYAQPRVVRYFGPRPDAAAAACSVEVGHDGVPVGRAPVAQPGGYSVYCLYEDAPRLSVNGIYVTDAAAHRGWAGGTAGTISHGLSLMRPSLCVVDPDANL